MKTFRAGCQVRHRTHLVNPYKTDTIEVQAETREEARVWVARHYSGEWVLHSIEYLVDASEHHREFVDDHCEYPLNCS